MTARSPAEQALQRAEERLHFALSASNVGVWESNFRTGTFYWSETCEALHGLEPGTFGGTFEAFLACIHPQDRDQVSNAVDQALRNHREAEIEYRIIRPDGTGRWISATIHFFYDEAGLPLRGAGIAVDVTERRFLEEQLRQAQKMEAVGLFAGSVAHDFNNLLTAILGNAELLLARGVDETCRDDVEEIIRAGRRASTLTRQLLAFSRKQILIPRLLRVGEVVSEMVPMLGRLLGETIELKTLTRDRRRVKVDKGQMEQVLINLAVNARDAMPDGGVLQIKTAEVELDGSDTRLRGTLSPGSYVMLAVSDTGHGMDDATRMRVFEPFFTTKPAGQGTGLGLSTVYGIVRQSGGHVCVESRLGRGATFTIYLPRLEQVEEAEEAPRLVSGRVHTAGGGETILLVEDEEGVRDLAYKALTRKGYSVHAAPDGARAVAFAGAYRDPIHVLLTDMVLPGLSGPAVATRVQQCHPESRVLYMSGYGQNFFSHRFYGAVDLLQKPFSCEALVRKVREVLDAGLLAKRARPFSSPGA